MAPSRPYFARLAGGDQHHPLYVPIVSDLPGQPFYLSSTVSILEPFPTALADSMELLGTRISDSESARPATVGDLRAGRAADIYWEIRGQEEGQTAFWKTNKAVQWPEPEPMDLAPFVLKHVIQAESRQGVLSVLDPKPAVPAHAQKFRAAVLKASKAKAKASASEPGEPSKAAKRSEAASASEPAKRQKIEPEEPADSDTDD
jgi:hypothetical protein